MSKGTHSILLPEDHLTLTAGDDIDTICQPLKTLGITFFNYIKNFPNGAQINLSNSASWARHFFDQRFYAVGTYENHPDEYYSGYGLWSTFVHKTISDHASTYFNIDHGITLIQKSKNISEFYCFGTIRDNRRIINFYLNHIDLLQRFVFYFKEKAKKLLNKAEQDKTCQILIPNHYEHKPPIPQIIKFRQNDNYENYSRLRKAFIQQTKIKHYTIDTDDLGEVTFTDRELEYITYLLQNKTVTAISNDLSLSTRTIESYIEKLKGKLSCTTKKELQKKLKYYFDFLER